MELILLKRKCFYFSYFKQELERETDPFRRILLLQEIRRVEQKKIKLIQEERMRIDQKNRNLETALAMHNRKRNLETALAMHKEREKQNKKK